MGGCPSKVKPSHPNQTPTQSRAHQAINQPVQGNVQGSTNYGEENRILSAENPGRDNNLQQGYVGVEIEKNHDDDNDIPKFLPDGSINLRRIKIK